MTGSGGRESYIGRAIEIKTNRGSGFHSLENQEYMQQSFLEILESLYIGVL
jgi:hypothetical protein